MWKQSAAKRRKAAAMENKKEKLVLDGNAFYELDLECLKHRKENMQKEKERRAERNRQRQRK